MRANLREFSNTWYLPQAKKHHKSVVFRNLGREWIECSLAISLEYIFFRTNKTMKEFQFSTCSVIKTELIQKEKLTTKRMQSFFLVICQLKLESFYDVTQVFGE